MKNERLRVNSNDLRSEGARLVGTAGRACGPSRVGEVSGQATAAAVAEVNAVISAADAALMAQLAGTAAQLDDSAGDYDGQDASSAAAIDGDPLRKT